MNVAVEDQHGRAPTLILQSPPMPRFGQKGDHRGWLARARANQFRAHRTSRHGLRRSVVRRVDNSVCFRLVGCARWRSKRHLTVPQCCRVHDAARRRGSNRSCHADNPNSAPIRTSQKTWVNKPATTSARPAPVRICRFSVDTRGTVARSWPAAEAKTRSISPALAAPTRRSTSTPPSNAKAVGAPRILSDTARSGRSRAETSMYSTSGVSRAARSLRSRTRGQCGQPGVVNSTTPDRTNSVVWLTPQ